MNPQYATLAQGQPRLCYPTLGQAVTASPCNASLLSTVTIPWGTVLGVVLALAGAAAFYKYYEAHS